MHFKLLAATLFAGLVVMTPAHAYAACCDQPAASCCKKQGHVHEASAIDMLLSMDPQWQAAQVAPPARLTADVWFTRPTLVGRSILQGHYIVEHDTDRMARGEPCTHIYEFDDRDRETPVVAFHCTHLERERAENGRVVLDTLSDGMRRLMEFQFAGEVGAHGYPAK